MFLFAAYRPDRWWYEVVETIRRLAMTGLLMMFKDAGFRLAAAFFLSFVSICLHYTMEPYADPTTNSLALISHVTVFMVFFLSQIIASGVVDPEKHPWDVVLAMILVLLRDHWGL